MINHWGYHLFRETEGQTIWFPAYNFLARVTNLLFWGSRDSNVHTSWSDWWNQLVDLWTNQNHSAIFHVHFHRPSQGSLCLFTQLFCFMNDQNLEIFGAFWNLHTLCWSNLLDNTLNDMSVMMVVIRWCNFNMIIALINCKFYCYGHILRFEGSVFTF